MSEPISITVQQTVHASLDDVWAVATDLRALPETMSGISRSEILRGGEPFGVGTRWRETRVMFGKEASEEMEVAAVELHKSYRVEAESNGFHYVSTFIFEALGPQETRVEMTFSGRPLTKPNFLIRLLSRFGMRMAARAMQKDLVDLGEAAERRTAARGG